MRSTHPHRPGDDHPYEHTVTFDIETVVDTEPADGSFPPWPQHRPVAASFLRADWTTSGYRFSLETLICHPREAAAFYAEADRLLPAEATSISYNGRGFDLPVLQLQAMAAHRYCASGLSAHTHAHRYGSKHCDLADQFSGYGGTRRVPLSELCATLSIPVKTSTHGSDVGALWRAGEIETIKRYVEEDVLATYLLWLHWVAFRASDERRIVEPLADLAQWIEQDPTRSHLLPFATCRPAAWARSRVLFHRVSHALTGAERRAQQAADERAFSGQPPIH